ncbi:MAG: hypothetical protein QXJ72_07725 [Thermoproteota archaeon]
MVSTSPTHPLIVEKPVRLVASWRGETNFITIGLIAGAVLIVAVVPTILVLRKNLVPPPPPI